MRAFFPPLVLVACAVENPAFFVTGESGAATAPATTASTGEPATTQSPATTGLTDGASTGAPPVTSTSSAASTSGDPGSTSPPPDTTGDTTGPVDGTTGEPGTSTSTSTTDPIDSSTGDGSTSLGPPVCEQPPDLGPLAKVLDIATNEHIKSAMCTPWAGVTYVGKLTADPMGFLIQQDMVCGVNKVPANLRITVPIPAAAKALNACVSIRFQVHANYPECHLSWLQIDQGGTAALTGRFGTAEPSTLPGLTVEPHLLPGCLCPDCCGVDAPDPGDYDLLVNGTAVAQGTSLDGIMIASKKFTLRNLRSHVHTQCDDPQYQQADWLHLDWVVARTQ